MTHLAEADLVEQCRCGHRTAQAELYRRYADAMFATCLRMCRTREDAEDVLQHAFAHVFKKFDRFRGESTVGAWIKRIVINHCLNHLKRDRARYVELADVHAPVDEPPDDPEPLYSVAAVRAAVAELPDGFRAVVTMYLFEGFDHGEIAAVLGISEQTSKSQYHRAKARLRSRLTQLHYP